MAVVVAVVVVLCALATVGDGSPVSWRGLYTRTLQDFNRGNFEEARRSAERAFARWSGRPDSIWYWEFRLALAESLLELNRFDDAAPLLRGRAISSELEARRLADCAHRAIRLRRLDDATSFLNAAEALQPQDPELIAKIQLFRGTTYMRQERYPMAEACFRRALSKVAGSSSLMRCYSLINLGYFYLSRLRYDEAVLWLDRAYDVAQRTGFSRAEAFALGNLGVSYLWLGDVDRGLKLLKDAASICDSLHDRIYELRWLLRLGEAYRAQRKFDQAYEYYEKARALAQPGVDDDWLANILSDLAELAWEQGNITRADAFNREAMRIGSSLDNKTYLVFPTLNKARIEAALNQSPDAERDFQLALKLSDVDGDPIIKWQAYSGLAVLYRSMSRDDDADRAYREALAVIDGERSHIGHVELKLTFLSNLIRFYQNYVDFLIDRGQPVRAFEVAASCRARVLAEKLHRSDAAKADSLARLQRVVADSGVVLMSYWLAPRRSVLWVIDSSGLRWFALPSKDEITKHVKRWTGDILDSADPLERASEDGAWLYSNLVSKHYRPAAGARIIIVPDGSLYELNFETLPISANKYWIEDATIAVAPSLRLLQPFTSHEQRRLLLIGNPDFKSDEFPQLSHVAAEMKTVSRHFRKRDVLDGSAATPDAYKRPDIGEFSTVHFAAHAVANRENPLDSAIILSGPADKHKLYARDVIEQHLNANLVTLSACQTAGNRTYAGEGLTGLAWAFLSAGAHNVVAGLWDVDDRATAQMMTSFYDALAEGASPAASLRTAKLALDAVVSRVSKAGLLGGIRDVHACGVRYGESHNGSAAGRACGIRRPRCEIMPADTAMELDRRQFIVLPGAALATSMFAAKADAPWHQRIRRVGQVNMTEHDPAVLDVEQWADYWASAKVDAVLVSVTGIVAFYPTKLPHFRRAKYLGDRDFFGDCCAAAKKRGIHVVARMSPDLQWEEFIAAKPEWFMRDAEGKPMPHSEEPKLYRTCMFASYYSEQIPAIMREINSRYDIDSIFTNGWPPLGRMPDCWCDQCRRLPRPGTVEYWDKFNERALWLWRLYDSIAKEKKPDSIYFGNLGGGIRATVDLSKLAPVCQWFNCDNQGRGGDTAPIWGAAQQGRVCWAMMKGRTTTNVTGAWSTGALRWRNAAKAPVESRMWMDATYRQRHGSLVSLHRRRKRPRRGPALAGARAGVLQLAGSPRQTFRE